MVYLTSNPPSKDEVIDWLTEVLHRPLTSVLPADVITGLTGMPFVDFLTALKAIVLNRDSSSIISLYVAWITANPNAGTSLAGAWFNLGVEAGQSGNRLLAAKAYQTALATKPDFYQAAINLGLQQEAEGDTEAAQATWAGAMQRSEARAALLNQSARVLEKTGQLADAERILRRSLLTDPAQSDVIQHWVHLRQRMCKWPVLDGDAVDLTQADLIADCGPLAALALTDQIAGQTAITARWLARKTVPVPNRLSPADGYKHLKVRLGYMSSDFGRHAMGYLITELLECHDRSRFTLHGYCLGREDGSDIRARIVRSFDHFISLAGMSDEDAARAITVDEIDILGPVSV